MTNSTSAPERYCLVCRYSLQGITERRCPECGKPFDPTDPRTFATTRSTIMRPGTRGDVILVSSVAAYAAGDFLLMMLAARGSLGRTPMELPFGLFFVSGLGTLATVGLFVVAQPAWMTWRGALAATALLALLTWFNGFVCHEFMMNV